LNNDFSSAGEPHQSLKQNAEYKLLFADRTHRFFANGGIMTPESLIPRYQAVADWVERSIVAESARWGDQHHSTPLVLEDWYDSDGNYNDNRAGRGWILDYYLPRRTDIVLGHFRSAGLYPSIDAPVFRINGAYRHGGHISSSDSFSITGSGTIYYTTDGNDPHVPVVAQGGGSTKLVVEGAAKTVLVPTDGSLGTSWTAIGFGDSGWTDGTPIISGKTGGVGYDKNSTYRPYIT